MIKNLNQLKKTLKKGTCFEIIGHCRKEYVGQKRMVTVANTQGFYSIIPDDPENKITLANNGKDLSSGGARLVSGNLRMVSAVCTAVIRNIQKSF